MNDRSNPPPPMSIEGYAELLVYEREYPSSDHETIRRRLRVDERPPPAREFIGRRESAETWAGVTRAACWR